MVNDADYLKILRLHHPAIYKAAVFQEGIASQIGHMLSGGQPADDTEEFKAARIAYTATLILASHGDPAMRGQA